MKNINAVLFDLDGTLLDTAPDLIFALNKLRTQHGLTEIAMQEFRQIATQGSKAMIKMAFGIEEEDPRFADLRQQFILYYETHIANHTKFFDGMEDVLNHLEEQKIPWGIVTNKLTRHTTSLLKALRIDHRPACVVCGDTLSTYKPDPGPILHACKLLHIEPADCLFVGDSNVDMTACKAAGTQSLAVLYGYISHDENPRAWHADAYAESPREILTFLK